MRMRRGTGGVVGVVVVFFSLEENHDPICSTHTHTHTYIHTHRLSFPFLPPPPQRHPSLECSASFCHTTPDSFLSPPPLTPTRATLPCLEIRMHTVCMQKKKKNNNKQTNKQKKTQSAFSVRDHLTHPSPLPFPSFPIPKKRDTCFVSRQRRSKKKYYSLDFLSVLYSPPPPTPPPSPPLTPFPLLSFVASHFVVAPSFSLCTSLSPLSLSLFPVVPPPPLLYSGQKLSSTMFYPKTIAHTYTTHAHA